MIIVFYRYVKRKNLEIAIEQEKNYFAEMEKHRRMLYEKMQAEHRQKENEILAMLSRHEQPSTSNGGGNNYAQFNMIDVVKASVVDDADLTDDEFFEMPLPPLPEQSPQSPTASAQTSIVDNEIIEVKNPTVKTEETPKVENVDESNKFNFPLKPKRAPPPPPLHIPSQPNFLPPLPPRPNTASPQTTYPIVMNPHRISTHPTIIDVTPKSMLESEL